MLEQLAPKALATLTRLLDSPDEATRRKAACALQRHAQRGKRQARTDRQRAEVASLRQRLVALEAGADGPLPDFAPNCTI